MNVRFQS